MKNRSLLLVSICVLLTICAPASADWTPGTPNTKWVQMPDTTPLGMDVYNSVIPNIVPPVGVGKYLADDFLCTTPGPITDVHIWGSWLNDILPVNSAGLPDPTAVAFKLSIHADVPGVPGATPSHPGPALWETIIPPGSYKAVTWTQVPDGEGFFNPNTGQLIRPADKVIWQYNFNIPPAAAFFQQGTTANPIVYWLDVLAQPTDDRALFGWKTRDPNPQNPGGGHFNDDAVWGDGVFAIGGSPTGWQELRYPSSHPLAGQSIDLAFALTTIPEPATLGLLGTAALILLNRRRR